MAIKIGEKSQEGSFKMYKGMAAFNIVAVNPNKEELSKITGRNIENEPEYLTKNDEGKTQMRVVFYGKTDLTNEMNNGIDMLVPISFMLVDEPKVGASSGKTQIIDKYGRTAWATPQELANKAIPQYSNGPANICADYRPAFSGEEFLVNFLQEWLNIPNPAIYKDKQWIMKEDPSASEVSLNKDALFKGNVQEFEGLVEAAKLYAVKAAVGIKTTDTEKGTRQYQTVFNRKFAKNAITNFDKIEEAIVGFQSNGGAPSVEFSTLPLHENVVEATNFSAADNDPLGVASAPTDNPWG